MSETRYPPAPPQVATHFLSAEDAPVQLEGLLTTGTADWGVVLCHPHPLHGGNMHNKVIDTAFRAVAAQGGHALRFNFRGVDNSEGTYGEGIDEAADLLGAIQHLREETETCWPLWLLGFSFGTRVISYHMAHSPRRDDVDGIIMLAPPVGSLEMHTFPVPPLGVHMILGDQDEFCTPDQMHEYQRRLEHDKVTTHVLPDTGHFFHKQLPTLAAWIAEQLPSRQPQPSTQPGSL